MGGGGKTVGTEPAGAENTHKMLEYAVKRPFEHIPKAKMECKPGAVTGISWPWDCNDGPTPTSILFVPETAYVGKNRKTMDDTEHPLSPPK